MNNRDPKSVTVWLIRALAYLAYAYIVVTEFILAQGFVLRLLGANPSSGYVEWAYRSLDRSMEPFRGIFEPVAVYGDAVLDTSILFAMFIYGILILLVRSLLDWLNFRLARVERYHAAEQAAAAIPDPTRMPPAAEPRIGHADTPES